MAVWCRGPGANTSDNATSDLINHTHTLPIEVSEGIGVERHDQEGRVLTLEFERYFLVCVYVPNAGQGLKRHTYRTEDWDVAFSEYILGLQNKGKEVILTGDLNVAHRDIDIYDPKGKDKYAGFTPEERQNFSSLLLEKN